MARFTIAAGSGCRKRFPVPQAGITAMDVPRENGPSARRLCTEQAQIRKRPTDRVTPPAIARGRSCPYNEDRGVGPMSCAAAMDPAPNAFRGAAALEGMMDLQTAVAASMLPGSRTVIASIFKEIRHSDIGGTAALSSILSLLCFPGEVHDEICDLALEQAEAALKRGRTSGFAALMAGDSAYPPLLACIPDPPPVLWILGDPSCPSAAGCGRHWIEKRLLVRRGRGAAPCSRAGRARHGCRERAGTWRRLGGSSRVLEGGWTHRRGAGVRVGQNLSAASTSN